MKTILDLMCAAGVLLCGIALATMTTVIVWVTIQENRRKKRRSTAND